MSLLAFALVSCAALAGLNLANLAIGLRLRANIFQSSKWIVQAQLDPGSFIVGVLLREDDTMPWYALVCLPGLSIRIARHNVRILK
jgi:hypothetical protein